MSAKRQKIQNSLALASKERGEAPIGGDQGTETLVAKPASENPAGTERLMEEVCARENLVKAWKRVRSNKGGPGVDAMTIDDAKAYLRDHWPNKGLYCSKEPISRCRSNGLRYPNPTAGSESSAYPVSSTD